MNASSVSLPFSFSWRTLLLPAAMLAPLFLYFDTLQSMVAIWNSSETFAHGYIILPISLWLIWQRRDQLASQPIIPFWPGLLLLAAAGAAWLLARLADVQVVQQYAVVAMFPLMALTLLGRSIFTLLVFPLAFLLLAVPFGEVFIDPLIGLTADFTVAALRLSGIPVWREGPNFIIPSGSWSVVAACSGVRYLIASFTLGCLYAYLNYRSRTRQLLFVALAIVVPLIANWIRAYGIVLIGHLSSNELATGVDHLIYGWVFFGVVILLMFWIGSWWREDSPSLPLPGATSPSGAPHGLDRNKPLYTTSLIALVGLALWPAFAHHINQKSGTAGPIVLSSFDSSWQASLPPVAWKPHFMPARAEMHQGYRHADAHVGLHVRYYRHQERGSLLISSSNHLAEETDSPWRINATGVRAENAGGKLISVKEFQLTSPVERIVVWQWYWVDGIFTSSAYAGKLLQARQKLLLKGDDGAALFLVAPYSDDAEVARQALRQFLSDNVIPLEQMLRNSQYAQANKPDIHEAAIVNQGEQHAGLP